MYVFINIFACTLPLCPHVQINFNLNKYFTLQLKSFYL